MGPWTLIRSGRLGKEELKRALDLWNVPIEDEKLDELIEVDETLRATIHEAESEQAMLAVARQKYPGIQEDGRRRILSGATTLEEVLRVTSVK